MLKRFALALTLMVPAVFATELRLASPSQVGTTKLDPGRYDVKLRGNVAVFSDIEHGKSYAIVTKPEKMEKKSESTVVNGQLVNGVQRVDSIVLSGSDQKLTFAKE